MQFRLVYLLVSLFGTKFVTGFLEYFPSTGKRETWPVDYKWAETIPVSISLALTCTWGRVVGVCDPALLAREFKRRRVESAVEVNAGAKET